MHAFIEKWKTALLTATIVAAGLIFLPARGQTPASAQGQVTPPPPAFRSVTVTGAGSAEVAPDIAVVILGVQTEAETAREALTQNNQQMDAVLTALRTAGIANADIRTSSIQLYPRYESVQPPVQGEPRTRLVGYNASNVVEVTVRNLNNLGSVLDQVVDAGSNQIQGIRFDVSDQNAALDQAREAAMQNASRKAQQLARLANVELGQVMVITENSSAPQPFAAPEMRMADSAVPIAPGTQSITVILQVTWELQ